MQLGAGTPLPEDYTQLSLAAGYSRFADERTGTREVTDADTPVLESWRTTLALRHHFGEGWSSALTVPTGTVKLEAKDDTPTRRISGFGDIEVDGRYDFAALWGAGGYRPSLTLRGALGMPTGETGTLSAPGDRVPPSLLSVGMGVYSATAELQLTQFVLPELGFSLSSSVRQPLGANENAITFGSRSELGLGVLVRPADGVIARATLDHAVLGRAESEIEGELLNSGSRVTAAGLALSVQLHERVFAGLSGRVPVRIDADGTQLVETYSAAATLALSFGGADDHDHDHAEHGHAEHADGDVRELATDGADFDVGHAAVAGKVTVVDFWAEWCHPCEHIDSMLRELAAKHEDLAVRRVEIVDDDSPAAKHLRGAALPVLWVYDRSGKRTAVLTAADEAAVRSAVLRALKRD